MSSLNVGRKVFDLNWGFSALLAESHVQRLNAEVARESHCSIDVVAEALEELGSLRFDDA